MKRGAEGFVRLGHLLEQLNIEATGIGRVRSIFDGPSNPARTYGFCTGCRTYGRLRGPIWVDVGLQLKAHWSCEACGSTRVPRGGELHWAQDPFFLRKARA